MRYADAEGVDLALVMPRHLSWNEILDSPSQLLQDLKLSYAGPVTGGRRFVVVWTHYMKYRAEARDFERSEIERILSYGDERYYDTATGRNIVIGRHGKKLVMIPYEMDGTDVVPITIHVTSRQQIGFRVKTGRFSHA